MAYRDDSPPVSLFSFQDIITSITGIMFLVVLLLALIILDSSLLNSVEEAVPERKATPDLVELKKKIAALQQLLKENKEEIRKFSLQVEEILPLPLEGIEQKLALEQEKNAELKKRFMEAKELRLSFENENKYLKKEVLRLTAEAGEQEALIKKTETEIGKEQRELEKQKLLLEKRKKIISYSVDSRFPKKLLIVECGPAGIRVKNVATGEVHNFIEESDLTYAASITKFLKWMKSRDKQTEYFSLVITPGAFGYADTLDKELSAAGFSRGKEILPADDSRIFEEAP